MTDKKLKIKRRAAMHVQQKRKARLVSYIQLSSTPAKIGAIRIGLDELDVSGSMADKVLYLLSFYNGRKRMTNDDNSLTIAYMCGYNDGKRDIEQSEQVQALRKDAERYRWLLKNEDGASISMTFEGNTGATPYINGEELEKAIDAAMEREND